MSSAPRRVGVRPAPRGAGDRARRMPRGRGTAHDRGRRGRSPGVRESSAGDGCARAADGAAVLAGAHGLHLQPLLHHGQPFAMAIGIVAVHIVVVVFPVTGSSVVWWINIYAVNFACI